MNAVTKAAANEVRAALTRAATAAEIGALTDRQLLDLLRLSPIGTQLGKEGRVARAKRRRELIAERDRGNAAIERAIGPLIEKCQRAQSEVGRIEGELLAARRVWDQAETERRSADLRHRYRVERINAELESLTPEILTAFIAQVEAEWEASRYRGLQLVGRNVGDAEEAAASNAAQIARTDVLRAVIRAAQALQTETLLDGEDLERQLEELLASGPELAKAARAAHGQ